MVKRSSEKAQHPALDHEIVLSSDQHSFRWDRHDVPSPLVRWHFHDAFELHLLQATDGTAYVGDHVGRFSSGSFFLVGPNLPHNWVSDMEPGDPSVARDVFIQFKTELIESLEGVFPECRPLRALLTDAQSGLEFFGETAREAGQLLVGIGELNGPQRITEFLRLLTLLADSDERRPLASRRYVQSLDLVVLRRINRIIQHIYSNYAEDFSQDSIAQQMNMSASTFSRFFKKSTGYNFSTFVNLVRIEQASIQLVSGNKQVSSIGFDCGFTNLSNFNRTFRRLKGVTPKQYRSGIRSRAEES